MSFLHVFIILIVLSVIILGIIIYFLIKNLVVNRTIDKENGNNVESKKVVAEESNNA